MLSARTTSHDTRSLTHTRIIRVAAYSVTSVLAVLLLTAALPPLVADQSDRAILDVPVTLITSPIAGEVSALGANVGTKVAAGTTVASVTNSRVDRTTLLTLQSKAADATQALASARSKRQADEQYVASLDHEIAAQKAQLIRQFDTQATDLKGQVDAAQALVSEKAALRDRQVNMIARDVASTYMLKPTTGQLSGAEGLRTSAEAKLTSSVSQLQAIKSDIFVGDNLVGIATLKQKRRDIAFDADRQKIEMTQAAADIASIGGLVEAEKQRIAAMESANLVSGGGEVLHVGVAIGRHVNPGDSLTTLVDCRKLIAVAIFSYREAGSLTVGTPMMIAAHDGDASVAGTVSEIIPKASDQIDALYAQPFPQSERREMYVIVRPSSNDAALGSNKDGACPVGRWVTVTRQDGWIPSTSVVWRKMASITGSIFGEAAPQSAEAHPRPRS